ncbi:lipolytic enzyme [Roridomyces roridus]|uniref:Lipolytic enzyme n=1 Tax=Roridomyces roridus TaxID=1738132 RepID=A0AAD7B9J3_9AGAR|nr:lipolytic enzyme [Roridomyces roridus]
MQLLLPTLILSLTTIVFAQSPIFGQCTWICGGQGWTGATTCATGSVCVVQNAFYSQCVPGTGTTSTSTTTTTVPPTSSKTSITTSSSSRTTTSSAPSSTATGLNIRLLPLGDSITYGFTSTDGNGYRATLHNLLSPGNTVDFIGSIQSGNMSDNNNEGHIGEIIEQIAEAATNSMALPARPNVGFLLLSIHVEIEASRPQIILLLAGTNDMLDSINSTAPAALSTLLDQIFTACPDATLIVSNLPALSSAPAQAAVQIFNPLVAQMVSTRAAAGQHILLVDMASVIGVADLVDGIHPTDAGYVKMGNAWFPVIQQAVAKGWVKAPVSV